MYLWRYFEGYPNRLVGEYDEKNFIDRFTFQESRVLNLKEKPIIIFEAKKEEILKYDDIENNGGAWLKIVSPKLADVLKEYANNDIEFVDVILRTKNGDITDYKIVHIIKEVKALNKVDSKFSFIPGSNNSAILGFEKLRLFENKLKDLNIALLTEYKSYIVISNSLKEKIKDFKGVFLCKDKELYHT